MPEASRPPAPEGPEQVLERARAGVTGYLGRMSEEASRVGAFGEEYFQHATSNIIANLEAWYLDPEIDRLSPNLKAGIRPSIPLPHRAGPVLIEDRGPHGAACGVEDLYLYASRECGVFLCLPEAHGYYPMAWIRINRDPPGLILRTGLYARFSFCALIGRI